MKIIQRPSPNFDERGDEDITILMLHYTGMKTAEEALNRLTDEVSEVSAHYTVDEDGSIYQHVEEGMRAWHAGAASWQGERAINAQSIGVEMVNPGHEWGYCNFPEVQLKATQGLCLNILSRHKDIEHVLAHSDVAPDRKQDPGELFPWKKFAEAGIGAWPDVSDEDRLKGRMMQSVAQSLRYAGYEASKPQNMLIAFQRHYVPEVFEAGTEGVACTLTRARLYALLSGHLLLSDRSSQ